MRENRDSLLEILTASVRQLNEPIRSLLKAAGKETMTKILEGFLLQVVVVIPVL
jgi:hypothetical protein